MRLAGVAAIVCALVAAGIAWFNSMRTTAAPRSVPSAATAAAEARDCPECVRLSDQIAALHRKLAAVNSQLASQQTQLAGRGGATDVRTPGSPIDPEEVTRTRAADDARYQEYMNTVAQSFANEKVDNAWAGRTSQRVNTAFDREEGLRDIAHTVECREKTCRVELQDDGKGDVSARIPNMMLGLVDVLPNFSVQYVDQGNGRSSMVLYLSGPSGTAGATRGVSSAGGGL